jgi:hypothetical protein
MSTQPESPRPVPKPPGGAKPDGGKPMPLSPPKQPDGGKPMPLDEPKPGS